MPTYSYRCTDCGTELEIVHRMADSISNRPHSRPDGDAPCDGVLERLIAFVAVNQSVGQKPPSDSKLERAGFTKYVRTSKGYEKALGPAGSPDFLKRE